MRSLNDPIRFLTRWRRLTIAIGAVGFSACAAWAFWPLDKRAIDAVDPLKPVMPAPEAVAFRSALDQSVFAVNLWHTPPAPSKPESAIAPEPPKPLNLQLIGIIHEAGSRRAALYDMDADRLLIVANGDRIRGHTIKAITDKAIELTDGRSIQRLTLAGDRS